MVLTRRILVDAVILGASAILGIVGYRLLPPRQSPAALVVMPEPGCDLHRRPCRATLPDGGQLELSLQPRPIPMLTPLAVAVRTSGIDGSAVAVDFTGVNMDMGPNHIQLAGAGTGLYQGQATLPVCVTGNMPWQAAVSVETPSGRISVPFRFDTLPAPGR